MGITRLSDIPFLKTPPSLFLVFFLLLFLGGMLFLKEMKICAYW